MPTKKPRAAKPKYLSARALGITPAERKWLIRAGEMLLTMKPGEDRQIEGAGFFRFNMANAGERTNCGTAGCIAGLANLLAETAGAKLYPVCRGALIEGHSAPLRKLFFPAHLDVIFSDMRPSSAGKATLHFLRTGRVEFEKNWRAEA